MTSTPTRTVTRTPTPTVPRPVGPEVIYFGIATAFNVPLTSTEQTDDGVPIYDLHNDFGFLIVVEARPGTDGRSPGVCGVVTGISGGESLQPLCADGRAAVQILADRALGNGSPAVCDTEPPNIGGVPAVPSLLFDPTQMVSDAIDDLACRFDNHQPSMFACTLDDLGNPAFVNSKTTQQYCTAPVLGAELAFKSGITRLKVQVQDGTPSTNGTVGNQVEIAVRAP
jgi:hypothetical protein